MQIETLKLASRSSAISPGPAEKVLDPRNDRHAWNNTKAQRFEPTERSWFGTPYSFNTKYVVEVEKHPEIGCVVTLVSGKDVHVNELFEAVNINCNRR